MDFFHVSATGLMTLQVIEADSPVLSSGSDGGSDGGSQPPPALLVDRASVVDTRQQKNIGLCAEVVRSRHSGFPAGQIHYAGAAATVFFQAPRLCLWFDPSKQHGTDSYLAVVAKAWNSEWHALHGNGMESDEGETFFDYDIPHYEAEKMANGYCWSCSRWDCACPPPTRRSPSSASSFSEDRLLTDSSPTEGSEHGRSGSTEERDCHGGDESWSLFSEDRPPQLDDDASEGSHHSVADIEFMYDCVDWAFAETHGTPLGRMEGVGKQTFYERLPAQHWDVGSRSSGTNGDQTCGKPFATSRDSMSAHDILMAVQHPWAAKIRRRTSLQHTARIRRAQSVPAGDSFDPRRGEEMYQERVRALLCMGQDNICGTGSGGGPGPPTGT